MPARKQNSYRYKTKYRRSKKLKGVKKVFKLVTVSVVGLFLFAVAFYLYSLTLIVKKPFANASTNFDLNTKPYDSMQNFNIVVAELEDITDSYSNIKSLYILHINADKSNLVLVDIPTDLKVDYSLKMGEGEIKKIYSMGSFGNEKRGEQAVIEFITRSLAINIDAFVIYDQSLVKMLSDSDISFEKSNLPSSIKINYYLKIPTIFDITRSNVLSDLSTIEALKLVGDIKSISNNNYQVLNLTKESFDSFNTFDQSWQQLTASSYLKSERDTAIILNSTQTPGIASWGARVVKNSGGVVIDASNQKQEYDENIIYTDIKDSDYLNFLVQTLNIDKVLPTSDYKIDEFLAKRADYLIVLGKKTAVRF